MRRTLTSQIEDHAKKSVIDEDDLSQRSLVPTGSTLFNLACSDTTKGAFALGTMVNIVGDNSSGKSIKAFTILAELCKLKRFRDHRLRYADVEAALSFDIPKLFGQKLQSRLELPEIETIQDFLCDFTDVLDQDRPVIYVLDSFDALTSVEELERTQKTIAAKKKGKEGPGSYSQEKTRGLSALLRQIVRKIRSTESLLIIISQVRQNLNAGLFGPKLVRTGGKALGHSASHEIWLTIIKRLKKNDRTIGIVTKSKVTKNRITGKVREVEFPIYYDYGIDDIGSCIDFLLQEKAWKKKGNKIVAKGLNFVGMQPKLVQHIENNKLEKRLRLIVAEKWYAIEESLKLNRKNKYK